jgi:hypothetical protein
VKLLLPPPTDERKPILNIIAILENDQPSINSEASVLSFDATVPLTQDTDAFQALMADGKGPCFAKAIRNECSREKTGQCRYDHSQEALRKLWLELDGNPRKSDYRPNAYQVQKRPLSS